MSTPFNRANAQYNIKLSDFEGPLDLLLHLIRESRLDIKTIALASVTSQYMDFLAQLDKLDLNLASEFVEVGATLVEIKSRNILPKPVEEEDDEEDPETRLKAQLEEYRLLKEAGQKLQVLENVDRFYKDPAEFKPEYKYVLDNLSVADLVEAFTKIMHRMHKAAAPIVERQVRMDRFTVKDKIRDIRTRLTKLNEGRLQFFDLFDADFTKSEMINTFLAILELLKTQEIRARQENAFADIEIVKGESASDENKGEENDEYGINVAD